MKRKTLYRVSVFAPPPAEDAVSALLERIFGCACSAYTDARTGKTSLNVYLEHRPDRRRARANFKQGLARIRAAGLEPGRCRFEFEPLPSSNWAEAWKRHFKPLEIAKALLIKPSWSRRRARKGQRVIILDPGLSFGTGQHPTTEFCLEQIAAGGKSPQAQAFLDIGTGSGILAIAAAKLGYAPVEGFDCDPEALRAARANARVNRVSPEVKLYEQDVNALPLRPRKKFSLVCANLLTSLLMVAQARIVAQLEPAGTLVLAGILRPEFKEVQAVYAAAGLELVASKAEGEWRSGAFRFRTT